MKVSGKIWHPMEKAKCTFQMGPIMKGSLVTVCQMAKGGSLTVLAYRMKVK